MREITFQYPDYVNLIIILAIIFSSVGFIYGHHSVDKVFDDVDNNTPMYYSRGGTIYKVSLYTEQPRTEMILDNSTIK